MANKLKITILSAACCNPALKTLDEQYSLRIKQALDKINASANIDVTTATEVYYGKKVGDTSKLKPLFEKYGMDALPALFVNDELVLYGGLPTIEKLSEVMQKALNSAKTALNQKV